MAARAAETPKRDVPDYDGRGAQPTTAGDVALWVPRVVLFPPYVVSEYVLRRPIGWLVSTAEKQKWEVALLDFFTFGPDRKVGIVPTALIDFGLRPSVGVYAWWDDALVKGNAVRAQFGTWGPQWINIGVTDRFPAGPGTMAISGSYSHRPDRPFFGMGPRSLQGNESRYDSSLSDGALEYKIPLAGWSSFVARTGARHRAFDIGQTCCGDPAVQTSIDQGRFAAPPGWNTPYTAAYQRLEVALDSRSKRPAPQTGVRLELDEEQASDVSTSPGKSWMSWGGTVGGYVEVGRARVIALKVTARFSDPLHGGPVPFTEQVALGGNGPMRGYLFGRLVDRSAAVAELEYRWPIWVWLDGTMHAAFGNVFGEHLQGFEPRLLRLSSGIGLRTIGSPDHSFELLTGFGTETIADGFKVDSFRLMVGGTRGF